MKEQASWWMGLGHPGHLQAPGCIHAVPFGERKSHFVLMTIVARVSTPRNPHERRGLEAGATIERAMQQVLGQSCLRLPDHAFSSTTETGGLVG